VALHIFHNGLRNLPRIEGAVTIVRRTQIEAFASIAHCCDAGVAISAAPSTGADEWPWQNEAALRWSPRVTPEGKPDVSIVRTALRPNDQCSQ
jgi:hypothetical protein